MPEPNQATNTTLPALIDAYAEARTAAARCHDLAHTLTDPDRDTVESEAARWEQQATARHAIIMSALDDLTHTTLHAVPDERLPVCTWQRGVVEVRGILPDGSRAVRVRYTPAEAIAAGTALIACGVVADTTGYTLGPILPPFPTGTEPGSATSGNTPQPSPTNPGDPAHRAGSTDTSAMHDCEAAGTLTFVAAYGAPGIGQAWACTDCGRHWARLSGRFHPADDGVHILSPADCI